MKANSDQEQAKRQPKRKTTVIPAGEAKETAQLRPERRLLPQDIPLWFLGFARHVLSGCKDPGVYQITLDVPVAKDQPREVQITEQRILRLARYDNARRPPVK